MKRMAWIVLLAALAGPGCLTVSLPDGRKLWSLGGEKEKPPPPVVKEAPPPPPVSDDQITETNAQTMADALRDELDYAATHQPAPPTTVVSHPASNH